MRLTNEQLLLLLAFAGEDGITVSQLSDRLGVAAKEAKWRLLRCERRGIVVRAGFRAERATQGRPAVVWRLAALDAPPAPKTTLAA